MHDRELGVSQEVTGTTDTMQHTRTVDVSGVGMSIDVNLDRSVHGDNTKTSNQLGVVRNDLGSQDKLLGELIPVVEESLETCGSQSDGGGGSRSQLARLEKLQEGVLENLSPDIKVGEVRVSKTLNDSVSNVANTGLQGVQVLGHTTSSNLLLEELNQVASNSLRHGIRRSVLTDSVKLGGLYDSDDLRGVNRKIRSTETIDRRDGRVGHSVRREHRHVDVVETLEGRKRSVDFNNDLVGVGNELRGSTDGRTKNNVTILVNTSGLDDGNVQVLGALLLKGVVSIGQILGEHGEMLVKEGGSAIVDGVSDSSTDLVRSTLLEHVKISPSRLDVNIGGSTDEKLESKLTLEVILFYVIGQCSGNSLGASDTGETRPANVLTVLEVRN